MMKKLLALLMALMLMVGFAFAETEEVVEILVEDGVILTEEWMIEYGYDYYSTEEVALYLYVFAELPPNFMTKDEAYDYGWNSKKGNLWEVAPGMCIGGDEFGNREGLLPEAYDRQYYECDVNYEGGYREAERVVFSNDGLIYYTGDHYESFDLLYEGWYDEPGWFYEEEWFLEGGWDFGDDWYDEAA